MPRADRINAGDRQLSARNINKVIEQANRLESAQGGSGIGVLSDETGLQIQNMRRRQRPDGETSYTSSGPLRRTIGKRSDSTRHKGEWELYDSSVVSQKAHTTTSGLPQFYGVPFLPVSTSTDSSNNINEGSLLWGVMDADEFGTSGPRSLERRSSSSGERFQIYNFDSSAPAPSSSIRLDVCVRANFGSSNGAPYIAWIKGGIENDHSWHYNANTNTITKGSIWLGDDSATDRANGLTGWDATPDTTTSITYYVKADWSSDHELPSLSWTNSASETETDDDEIVLYPIIEFDSNGVCTERCQCDIHLPEVFIPKPPAGDAALWYDYTANKFKWTTTAPSRGMVLTYTDADVVDFGWPTWRAINPVP